MTGVQTCALPICREKVCLPLYGGKPIREKPPLRSLDDVEGEVGFDGVRTCPLALLLKELGGPKDCGVNWVSGHGMKNNSKKMGVPWNHSGILRQSSFYAQVQAFSTSSKGRC